jgi:hypothetical protein
MRPALEKGAEASEIDFVMLRNQTDMRVERAAFSESIAVHESAYGPKATVQRRRRMAVSGLRFGHRPAVPPPVP